MDWEEIRIINRDIDNRKIAVAKKAYLKFEDAAIKLMELNGWKRLKVTTFSPKDFPQIANIEDFKKIVIRQDNSFFRLYIIRPENEFEQLIFSHCGKDFYTPYINFEELSEKELWFRVFIIDEIYKYIDSLDMSDRLKYLIKSEKILGL